MDTPYLIKTCQLYFDFREDTQHLGGIPEVAAEAYRSANQKRLARKILAETSSASSFQSTE